MRGPQSGLTAVLAALLSCAPAATSAPVTKPPVASAPGFVVRSPARWLVFPQSVGEPRAVLPLDDARCLVTTDDGQRWLVEREPTTADDDPRRCVGKGRASGDPSYEALAFAEPFRGGFRFLSDAGSLYVSETPTGPFGAVSRPPELLEEVSVHGATVVGVAASGAAYRFEEEWAIATLPDGTNAVDVGVAPDGSVLLLSLPEQLLFSADAGRSFAPFSGAPPRRVGAYAIEEGLSGAPLVIGAFGNLVKEGDRIVAATEGAKAVASHDVAIEPVEGPNVFAIDERRAAIDGSTYLDVTQGLEGGLELRVGPLSGPFERRALPLPEECLEAQLGAAHGLVAVACLASDDVGLGATFYLSRDQAKTFERGARVVVPGPEVFSFSLAESGALLVVGACKPEEKPPSADAMADGGDFLRSFECAPRGPLVVRGTAVTTSSAPDAEIGTLVWPLFSREGRLAYAFGRKKRTSEPAIFVSRDGGRTFKSRVIENPNAGWDDDLGEEGERQTFYVDASSRLTMDDTGALGMPCVGNAGDCWLTFDSDGRVANVGAPPDPASFIDGRGNRVFAVGSSGQGYESMDGGVTWGEVPLTAALPLGYAPRPSFCSEAGCLLGPGVVREGWEGQEEKSVGGAAEVLTVAPRGPTLGQPIACEVTPGAEVTRITGRSEERTSGSSWTPALPRLRDVGRGKTAFSVLATSPDGAVDVFSAPADGASKPGQLVKKQLLKPLKKERGWVASTTRWQVEGYAAARAIVPVTKGSSILDTSQKLKGLEVAWQNQFTDVTVQRRVDFDASWSHALVNGSSLRLQSLSTAGPGLAIQTDASRVSFLTRDAVTSLLVPNFRAALTDRGPLGRVDYLSVGSSLTAVSLLSRPAEADIVAFAPMSAARDDAPARAADVSAYAVATDDATIDFTYRGDAVGISVVNPMRGQPADRPRAFGLFFQDGALGAPIALPTVEHLTPRTRACTADERATTPRSASSFLGPGGLPLFAADRAPLLLSEPIPAGTSLTSSITVGPSWFLLEGAILHGTPSDPCVAFYRASAIRGGAVAVLSGDLQRAWLLRSGPGSDGQPGLDVKALSCKRTPDLLVPNEVVQRVGLRLPDDP